MATESPVRMVESGGARKWSGSKDSAALGSPLRSMAAEELGLLLKGQGFHGDEAGTIPCRSGSAPPSMEGSFAAIGNLLAQHNSGLSSSMESLGSVIENCESEEQLRSEPAYFAYYCSNVNLNPRLPPPLLSRENRRLVHHIGGFGNNWRPESGNGSLQLPKSSLSTHKEEPNEDRSPRGASENSGVHIPGQNTTSLAGRHKSLVDLIQEDFPRTPSPVYSQSRSSSHAAEVGIDHDVHAISSNVSSASMSKISESNAGSDVCVDTYALEVDALRLISISDSPSADLPTSPCHAGTPTQQKGESSSKGTGFEVDASIRGSRQSGASRMELRTKNKQDQQSYGRNIPQHHSYSQQGIPYQVQVISQGTNPSHSSMEKPSHGYPKFSSTEVLPPSHSPATNPPFYAPQGAYMTAGTPFYQPSSVYHPQYSMGGYAVGSAFISPYMPGFPSHRTIPVSFGGPPGPSNDGRSADASGVQQIGSLQHLAKFYGQHGLMLQPSFVDPLHAQPFQHPFGDVYSASPPHNRLASSGTTGPQIDSFIPQKDFSAAAYMSNQKVLTSTNGGLNIPIPGKGAISGGSYYGGPPSMGVITHFPASPLTSPALPSSPVGGFNHLSRRTDLRFPQGSSRNAGSYFRGQEQRAVNSADDPKRHYFLEELKSNNAQKFELSDVAGRIVEFSVDQHGSRFIQQKLENCNVEEKECVFKEVLPHAPKLMTDVFGNYVIQKFFEHGSPQQRIELAEKLSGQMLQLSLQMYGCRVIQKALDVIELDQKAKLAQELDGHVMRCVHDQNGNHVIQKCIECVPAEHIEFIISAFRGQVVTLSTHPYGCRVIQRILEHCSDELQSQCIVDEILESTYLLAQDQYGNYVTQHVLERGKPHERSQIISKLTGKIVQMSQHKYASNVVEKCLKHADAAQRELMIGEIIGQSEENDNLLMMMKDQFANYVVQKILETSNDKQKEILLSRINAHLNALKKYTYGKHIVARFEQLCGEESQVLET
uniref:PUM-HD domain-containing protein n=1 Tax=Salix viminalis TaxID=40686 RepID=A0A6N2LN22_SALVM